MDGPYKVVCKAAGGAEALEGIRKLKPTIAIMDISMPDISGLDVISEARNGNTETEFIILTMYKDREYFNKAIDLGVKGYILKENAEDELLDGLKTVLEGKHYISPILTEHLIAKNREMRTFAEENPSIKFLSHTERRVIKLISENKTSKEIGKELCISHKTVENHRTNIIKKLELTGRNQLFLFALENRSLL